MKENYLLSIYIYIYTTIATTVAIKQFIRPNWSELLLLWANRVRTYGIGIERRIAVSYAIRYNTSIDTIDTNGESMAEWLLNNRILLVSVGYIRRGNTTKTVVQPDRSNRRAYTSTRMLWIRAIKSLKHMIDMKHMNHAIRAASEMVLVQLHLVDRLNPSWM